MSKYRIKEYPEGVFIIEEDGFFTWNAIHEYDSMLNFSYPKTFYKEGDAEKYLNKLLKSKEDLRFKPKYTAYK